ncbi:MAG TPA: hypothetical protein VF867_15240 [Arthrobacter sp.]
MPPSDVHRFYLPAADTVIELQWAPPEPPSGRSFLERVGAYLAGPDPSTDPWHAVDHRSFEKAVDALAVDPKAACASFTRLGYVVTVDENPELRSVA